MSKKLNLACGKSYIKQNDWINIDYIPIDNNVVRANLLDELPFEADSIYLVYSSHFLEHIPKSQVVLFLSECFRIIQPGGVIRLVLPDFEKLCSEYLEQLHKGNFEKANFCVTEIVDQCVRQQSGGDLKSLYQHYGSNPHDNEDMIQYIKACNGETLEESPDQDNINQKFLNLAKNPNLLYKKLTYKLEKFWIHFLVSFLPKNFRQQNVSFANTGERHQWLWDFTQLKHFLELVGFEKVNRYDYKTSQVDNFSFSLDVDSFGFPRKGWESMYVEAQKPK